MTFSRDDPREQLHVRLEPSFKKQVESVAETHGMTLTELTRTALEEFMPKDETRAGPTSQKLLKPYRWIRENSDDRGEIAADLAMSALAQELGMPKKLVKQSRLNPLRRRGWIDADFGTITVNTPEDYNHD